MKDTFLSARLVEPSLIRLVLFSSLSYEPFDALLLVDKKNYLPLKASRINSTSNVLIAEYHLSSPLELGHSYALSIYNYPLIPLDVSEATSFPDFDRQYAYHGNDLGATWHEDYTDFVLWAPLASSVVLKVRRRDNLTGRWHFREMERGEHGVWRLRLKGDYSLARYSFVVTNSEVTIEAIDPYAKASGPNGEYSVVLNPTLCTPLSVETKDLPSYPSPTSAIVYETSIRDISVNKDSNIFHKAQYLGLVEEGRKSKGGNPAGLDYLLSLGVTHVQILPFYDFATIDERHPLSSYNWGYDPQQYFVPEGSYSQDVENPLSRINECRQMIDTLHKKGIRVIMDAVYNHVYEYQRSSFEKIVPNYYFRRKKDGRMANTSYCGDDVASERTMVRKLIVDSAKHWIDFYGVNGFRFDLMGIVDVDTLKAIERYGKSKDSSFLLYGEGWNMGGEVNVPLGHMDNASLLPGFGFFNDFFRETVKKFLACDMSVKDAIKYSYLGSCHPYGYLGAKFKTANQSVNYIECHDDKTFFDWLSEARPDLPSEEKLELAKLGIAFILLSRGMPFIHMGQELGLTKFGRPNTYNSPDIYNQMPYRILDERKEMYDYVCSLIRFRKGIPALADYDASLIGPKVDFEDLGAALHVHLSGDGLGKWEELDFFFNPAREPLTYECKEDHILVLDNTGDVSKPEFKTRRLFIPKETLIGVGVKKKSIH